ncbi:MAG TPA: hypothetical protein VEL75_04340 [Candidatus Methylomirabilis sp.]|nr:hypothetical protein [Candidatus Methylomirabilis sp.]
MARVEDSPRYAGPPAGRGGRPLTPWFGAAAVGLVVLAIALRIAHVLRRSRRRRRPPGA